MMQNQMNKISLQICIEYFIIIRKETYSIVITLTKSYQKVEEFKSCNDDNITQETLDLVLKSQIGDFKMRKI